MRDAMKPMADLVGRLHCFSLLLLLGEFLLRKILADVFGFP